MASWQRGIAASWQRGFVASPQRTSQNNFEILNWRRSSLIFNQLLNSNTKLNSSRYTAGLSGLVVWCSLRVREGLMPIYYFFIFPRLFRTLALANVRKSATSLGYNSAPTVNLVNCHAAKRPRCHAATMPRCQHATLSWCHAARCHPLPYLCFFTYAILQSFQRIHRSREAFEAHI